MKKLFKCLSAFALTLGILPVSMPAYAQENTVYVDHTRAEGVSASANDVEVSYWGADKTIDGIVNRDASKPDQSRWSSNLESTAPADKSLTVDLGAVKSFDRFIIEWERTNVDEFFIEVSDDGVAYTQVYISEASVDSLTTTVDLATKASGRYVRLTMSEYNGGDINWASISLYEFSIQESVNNENLALHKEAVSQSNEDPVFSASNATDGDDSTRWASGTSPLSNYLYVDLGSEMSVANVNILWERLNAVNVEIQIATTLSSPMTDSDWQTVHAFTQAPVAHEQSINLAQTMQARYVRVKINEFTETSSDTSISWPTVSIYELEVYSFAQVEPQEPEVTLQSISNAITLENPTVDQTSLDISHIDAIPHEGFSIVYNGTDYEQVIGDDLAIYRPIVDTVVKPNFKITNLETGEYAFKEVSITVPGMYETTNTDNEKPEVIPELREWKGESGHFYVTNTSKIVVASDALVETANIFASDFADMTGQVLSVQVGGTPETNDFYFTLSDDVSKGYQEEGYLLDIGEYVHIEATTQTGSYYGTRSILQILQASSDMSIPKGITRDYPLYEVRGFMLDVGRKTFELEYLYDLMEEMSWYKLNDFQLHLNDNYIFLEKYTAAGLDPMDAYAGFRLESNIVEGGNNGLNQADLTSKDLYYTKDEYVDLLNVSESRGVTIVPEFDTPAHSLALTLVRPDLRQGTSGRENDHLDLINSYDESLSFVQSIFSEYMEGADPVFPTGSVVHLGLDEYTASSSAFRDFSNDMIDFAETEGYVPRIWGSLTSLSQGAEVLGDGVQMNLWNTSWANFQDMYELGFDLINTNDGDYYIVPDAGYYYDYLNKSHIYNKDVNSLGGYTVPAGDSQMLGGMFAVWNDQVDLSQNGTSEYDVYVRIKDALPYFASAVWGKLSYSYEDMAQIVPTHDEVPNTNLAHEVESATPLIAEYAMSGVSDTSENGYDLIEAVNATYVEEDYKEVVQLEGGESYIETPLDRAGVGNSVRIKVKRTSDSTQEQILLESSNSTIKAVQEGTGRVGFSREGIDYSFNYTLPMNTWVELEFKTEFEYTYLYVDGVLMDTLGDESSSQGRGFSATLMLPIQRIGSTTNAFVGFVDEVIISQDGDFISTMSLERLIINAKAYLETAQDDTLTQAVQDAEDLIASKTYTQTQLQQAQVAIQAAIEQSDFDSADYSQIETLMNSVSSNTSLYTVDSYANFMSVYNTIVFGLHESFQSTVDDAATQLQAAIHALVVNEEMNLLEIDNDTMNATSSSNQDSSSSALKAIDNDPSTIWHTVWVDTPPPHHIEIELNEVTSINRITYLTREIGTNGNIQNYSIEVSSDGSNYTSVKEGTLSTSYGLYTIDFDAVDAKYVRINVLSSSGGFGSAAEIDIYKADVVADFDTLQAVIDEASALQEIQYTLASWTALQDAITLGEAFLADSTTGAQDVYNATVDIVQAMSALVYLSGDEVADYSELNALIAQVEAMVKENYTSFAAVEAALNDVVAGLLATQQAQVNAFAQAIEDAVAALVLKAADYSAVDTAIASVPADTSMYTQASVDAVQSAIDAVEYGKDITMQSEVDAYAQAIEDAIDALVLKAADYSVVDTAIASVPSDMNMYTQTSIDAVQAAIDAVEYGKDITMQSEVDAYAQAIEDAIDALVLKAADYSAVDTAIASVPSDMSMYTQASVDAVQSAIDAVEYGKDITMQSEVDAYAQAVEEAIANLVMKTMSDEVEGASQIIGNLDEVVIFRVAQANIEAFVGVRLDGVELASSDYNVKEGSIIIEFAPAFLATLSEGSHVLEIVTTDAIYTTNFMVALENTQTSTTPGVTPPTGDTTNVFLYFLLLLLSGVSIRKVYKK